MRLFIEPAEPLMFRTAHPFDAGQNNFAESMFPPTPETLQGAVRAAIAAHWDPNKNIAAAFADTGLTKLIGDRNGYGRFRMTGIALGRYPKTQLQQAERLFPAPAHIMKADSKGDTTHDSALYRLLPRPIKKGISSNWPAGINHYLQPTPVPDGDLMPVEGWLTETDLLKTLGTETLTGIKSISREEIYQKEPRLGIGIQSGTKATEEGYLYQMLMIRMNHQINQNYIYGFIVDITLTQSLSGENVLSDSQIQDTLHLPLGGWLTLGGEQRTARFHVLEPSEEHTDNPIEHSQKREGMLLYLATPASFKQGWRPPTLPSATLITAAINRYEPIGGWRLNPEDARGENKVMRRCVAAGSVYFFHTNNDYKNETQPRSLTDHGMEIGYGITYEGEW